MAKQMVLLAFAALLAFILSTAPRASAFDSPIPRPTLDPAWVCQQLGNCPEPAPRRPPRRHDPHYITLPAPAFTEPSPFFRLP